MTYVFTIPGPLREHSGNRDQVRVSGEAASVTDALDLLWRECPGVRDRVLTERGEVRQHINVFVNGENIRDRGGLTAPIGDGAEIMIIASVSGG